MIRCDRSKRILRIVLSGRHCYVVEIISKNEKKAIKGWSAPDVELEEGIVSEDHEDEVGA